jgi:hypothetical protein
MSKTYHWAVQVDEPSREIVKFKTREEAVAFRDGYLKAGGKLIPHTEVEIWPWTGDDDIEWEYLSDMSEM